MRVTHFGIENALAGESPSVYFHHADYCNILIIYQSNPNALPPSIRKRYYFFSIHFTLFLFQFLFCINKDLYATVAKKSIVQLPLQICH